MCNNKDALVGYLYDDLPDAERAEFEAHLGGCAECRQELGQLRQTRQHLGAWAPPGPEVNFRVVRGTAAPPRRRLDFVPRWALAAAASLFVLAGAAAIANLQVEYGGVVIRAGWAGPAPAAAPPARIAAPLPAAAPQPSSEEMGARFARVEQRLHDLERAQTQQPGRIAAAVQPGVTTPELRKVLTELESRLRAEMAIQIRHVWTDFNAARASDFYRVQQTLAPEIQRNQRQIESLLYLASPR
jgi:hypothetical protein